MFTLLCVVCVANHYISLPSVHHGQLHEVFSVLCAIQKVTLLCVVRVPVSQRCALCALQTVTFLCLTCVADSCSSLRSVRNGVTLLNVMCLKLRYITFGSVPNYQVH